MKKIIFLFALNTAILLSFGQQIIPQEVIIMLEPGITVKSFNPANYSLPLRFKETLSPRWNIHLFASEQPTLKPEILLKVQQLQAVRLAQYNHRVGLREGQQSIPSDSLFDQQWALDNTGQGGGSIDADIDAPEAWDLSRGGLTFLQDTMVVAVIDDGFDLNHEDILYWKNKGEIPNNNLDDDNNGFVDDFDGWNAYNNSGQITSNSHGTEAAGIIAAIADNQIGISGIGWRSAVLPIMGLSGVEATVIKAYDYILQQRLLYEKSGGQAGAFIVATNASFGVDNGLPADFPIWCAIYDSLGQYGILSVAATTNRNVNVDQVGDIPTACSSDFLITVTNSNISDQKDSRAAFGPTTIDLAAPGTGVLTTYTGNRYGPVTGTSFASPLVAGVVPLMLAAACPELSLDYVNNPAETALKIKAMILNGSDTLAAFQNKVRTDGRLNAFQAINLILDSCQQSSDTCLQPYRPFATPISGSESFLFWNQIQDSQNVQIRLRERGTTNWTHTLMVEGLDTLVNNLSPCTAYEWQVAQACGNSFSSFTPSSFFRTLECCEAPPAFDSTAIADSSIFLSWSSQPLASMYQLQYRAKDQTNWIPISLSEDSLTLQGLETCTDYEVQLWSICANAPLDTLAASFKTQGCGSCTDLSYCQASAQDVDFEWIDSLSIGPIKNASGKNGGFGDFTDETFTLILDSAYEIFLQPGYESTSFTEKWRVWIDGDQNGVFDSDELLLDPEARKDGFLDTLFFPQDFRSGQTRMRVAMRWAGFNFTDVPESCGSFGNGEVEDYCIFLSDDPFYCESSSAGLGSQWIQKVVMTQKNMGGKICNESGIDENGYGLYDTRPDTKFLYYCFPGHDTELEIIPGAVNKQSGYWRVWGDWSDNGIFESSELWLDTFQVELDTLRKTLRFPTSGEAIAGDLRMRFILRKDSTPEPCGEFLEGEVEDYFIELGPISSIEEKKSPQVKVFPNPTQDSWKVSSEIPLRSLFLYDLQGRLLHTSTPLKKRTEISTHSLSPGIYILRIETSRGSTQKKLSLIGSSYR